MSVKDSSGNEIINVVRRANHGAVISYRNIDYTMARHDGRYEQTFAATNTVRSFKDETTGELSKNFKSLKCHKSRNLFDGTVEQGSVNTSGSEIASNYRLRTSKIVVQSSNTYTISSNLYVRLIGAFNNNDFVSTVYDRPTDAVKQVTFTMPDNANQIQIVFKNSPNDNTSESAVIITADFEWGMLNTGTSPLPYEPYGELYSADLKDYRIYGDTSKNILPLSKTPKTETIGDILCEYDGKGTFTFTSEVDNPTFGDNFVVPLEEEFTFPASINDGGTGCIQLNNNFSTDSLPYIFVHFVNIDEGVFIDEAITSNNMLDSSYDIDELEGHKVTSLMFQNLNAIGKRTIKIQPAVYLDVSTQQPFEPYGESVGDRTGNLFDSNINVISGYLSDEGILKPATETRQITFGYLPIISGTYTFKYRLPSAHELWFGVCTYDESRTFQSRLVSQYSDAATFTIPDTTKYIRISLRGYNKTPIIMLNTGSEPLPYEPYGYRVPVKVEGKNLYNELYTLGIPSGGNVRYEPIFVGDGTFTCSSNIPMVSLACNLFFLSGNVSTGASTVVNGVCNGMSRTIQSTDGYVTLGYRGLHNVKPADYHVMINTGSSATPYEPYQTPVMTNIYLPEQIKMVGDEAEYIDFGEQKQYFADGTSVDVTLPALPTLYKTNTISVESTVAPSRADFTGHIKNIPEVTS